jgi:uncharacterized protein (DUF1501 family)
LLGLGGAVAFGPAALALAAAPTDRRFIVVILRGALDGMSAVVPYGDPHLTGLRAPLVPPEPGRPEGVLDLGGFFGLDPALAALHEFYKSGELLPIHAIAGATRSRSHFDAQDSLESGAEHRLTSGWLNRVAALLPASAGPPPALAIGPAAPLLLRGPAPVGSWMPPALQPPPTEFYARVVALHESDPVTGPSISAGLHERGFAEAVLAGAERAPNRNAFPALAAAAGMLLAVDDGPRLAAMELGGWDTHTDQTGRLNGTLRQLDAGLVALRTGLGTAWARSVVFVVTEFGRTARVNGTWGTDHGTGTVAFVLGGAVAGGKVRADWPGLGPGRLLEDRDLQPTADLRSVGKGLLVEHLRLDPLSADRIFPDSRAATSMRGLLRA